MSLLVHGGSIVTPVGRSARRADQLAALYIRERSVIRCSDEGEIEFIGPRDEHDRRFQPADEELDTAGGCILPGFVDPHTHPVSAGSRETEFDRRLRGESYMEIAHSGGGINATVRATRAATTDHLLAATERRLDRFLLHGTTTIEAKSGYGLDLDTEVRMLEVIRAANCRHVVDLVPTCLAAHEVPLEHRADPEAWIRRLIDEIHPHIAAAGLAEAVDVFCEDGVFDLEQTRRLLVDAADLGWRIHLHADELTPLGGAELAVEMNALSADHLMCVTDAGIAALASSNTMAVLLPGTSFFLRSDYAPARRLIDEGCTVALATDCNPGSSPTESMPMVLALACLGMGLSVAEALTAATLNAAAALDRADDLGSIEVGKRADLSVLGSPNYHELVYHFGVNPIRHVIKNGQIVVRDAVVIERASPDTTRDA
ncbi:MAG: imidazolonepropionase [Holophagae bacterium]|jgi:imidazolonepropionase